MEQNNARQELYDICLREFQRDLNDTQLNLLWALIQIAPGTPATKWTNLHEYITTALEGLDTHAPNHPRLEAWGTGGR
jgi:hypothetical protein